MITVSLPGCKVSPYVCRSVIVSNIITVDNLVTDMAIVPSALLQFVLQSHAPAV